MARPAAATPLYLRLAQTLERDIALGTYPVHQALPSERALADASNVSRVTARKAIDVLVRRGLVVCRHGSGNFIATRLSQSPSTLASFSNELRQRGLTPSSRWISQRVDLATASEMHALALPSGMRVARLERLRLANGEPLAYEISVLPASVLPRPGEVGESLYQYLAQHHRAPVRALQRIQSCNAPAAMALALQIPPGTAVLWITRTAFDASDHSIEFTQSFCRSDTYDFVSELKATP